MSTFTRFLLPILLIPLTLWAQNDPTSAYQLNTGDTVQIQVFGESDLTLQVRIGERGTIPYPFLGEIDAAGLTTEALADAIIAGLKGPYLVDPRVSVTIAQYRSFFLNGEVQSPGSYQWEPGMTVRKAVALAGGLADHASTRKIFLRSENGASGERARVDLDHPIGPGDIITIEEGFF